MRILAIETSCDETAIAIVERKGKSDKFKILTNIVSSQAKLHAKFGGVVPNLANREHQKNLVPILITSLKEAKLYKEDKHIQLSAISYKLKAILEREPELLTQTIKCVLPLATPKIDAIAITYGPGLEPALWVGINFTKALALLWNKPIIPINHMEGHIYSALLQKRGINSLQFSNFSAEGGSSGEGRFPIIALLVSGGHTELLAIKKMGHYKLLGETLDDAAGEAFDKVSQMLNLGYPGGPAIAKFAEKGAARAIAFPRPMINSGNLNFSFSGLKTAVLYYLRDCARIKTISRELKADIAASFQQAAIDALIKKTISAAKICHAKTVLLGGGVAANKELQKQLKTAILKEVPRATFLIPENYLTGDNALMIALVAFFRKKKPPKSIRADGALKLN